MTLEQLERKTAEIQSQLSLVQLELRQMRPLPSAADTFGMFADDAEFDEIVRLGRDYRKQANAETQ